MYICKTTSFPAPLLSLETGPSYEAQAVCPPTGELSTSASLNAGITGTCQHIQSYITGFSKSNTMSTGKPEQFLKYKINGNSKLYIFKCFCLSENRDFTCR